MHHDEVKSQAAGQPSVFGHGMLSMGLLASALSDYVGAGNLIHYQVRFVKQTWPGEDLVTHVVVTGKRKDGERNMIDLDCVLRNSDGEEKVVGTASAVLSSRG